MSGSLESLLTSEDPVKKKKKSIHIVSGAKFAAKCPFSPNSTVTKPSKPSSGSRGTLGRRFRAEKGGAQGGRYRPV